MLGKKFDNLIAVTAIISTLVLFSSPFSEKPFLGNSAALLILLIITVVIFTFGLLDVSYGIADGIDKDKGLNDEVNVFIKRIQNSFEESRIIVTTLSTDSKREIKNILEEIEELTRIKDGVFSRLISPSLFSVVSTTLYLIRSAEIPRGTLATTTIFVFSFSAFCCFIQMYFYNKIGAKNNAIADVGMKKQHIFDDKGLTETIRPFIFNCNNYREIEGYPVDKGIYTAHFYSFLDNLRTTGEKSEVDKILKDFLLTENSHMNRGEKAKTNFMLMERLDNLAKKTNKGYLYREHI